MLAGDIDVMTTVQLAGFTSAQLGALTNAQLGVIDVYILFGLAVLLGINNPFTTSARMNILPLLVTPMDFPTAIAVNSMLFNLARILGPTFAGLASIAAGQDR